jgi:hypothetical protein
MTWSTAKSLDRRRWPEHDIERIYAYLSRVVPAQMLQLLTDAIGLNKLSNQLDHALLLVLADKLGVTDTITPQLYAEGYRVCDNYAERKYRIDLTTRLLRKVAEGRGWPGWASP